MICRLFACNFFKSLKFIARIADQLLLKKVSQHEWHLPLVAALFNYFNFLQMKKSLFVSLAIAAGFGTVLADSSTPTIYPECSFQRISADGRFIVSEVYGTVKIFDLVDGSSQNFYMDEENWVYNYALGLGNCITADGSIILGSTKKNDCDAAYLENGVWKQLNVPSEENTNLSNGITPDGKRICGSVGLAAFGVEDALMQAPCYWDRQADGTYSECHMLPYPTKDLFGEKPQYVTALAISEDGKTIAGQMVFSSGMMTIPVLYQEDAEGNWSYTLPTKDLFNPEHLEVVENPGGGPESPNYESYMTEADMAAYNDALNKYYEEVNAWYEAGDYEAPYPEYPEYTSFMSEEQKAAYDAAVEAYDALYNEWQAKFDAFQEYQYSVEAASPNFLFNNVLLSTDGKYIVGTLETEDPNPDPMSWFPSKYYIPCTVEIATNELKTFEVGSTCSVSAVANDGVIFGYNGQNKIPMIGYIIKDGEVKTIEEYISTAKPEYGQWIKENMTHEVVVGYTEDWEEIIEEVTFTGMPIATPDMKVIAFWNNTPWDYESNAEGVVFNMDNSSSVITISDNNANLKVGANATVIVPEGFVSLEVYNVAGVCVKTVSNPAGSVELDVANGLYIAKGIRNDGSASVVKLSK